MYWLSMHNVKVGQSISKQNECLDVAECRFGPSLYCFNLSNNPLFPHPICLNILTITKERDKQDISMVEIKEPPVQCVKDLT